MEEIVEEMRLVRSDVRSDRYSRAKDRVDSVKEMAERLDSERDPDFQLEILLTDLTNLRMACNSFSSVDAESVAERIISSLE